MIIRLNDSMKHLNSTQLSPEKLKRFVRSGKNKFSLLHGLHSGTPKVLCYLCTYFLFYFWKIIFEHYGYGLTLSLPVMRICVNFSTVYNDSLIVKGLNNMCLLKIQFNCKQLTLLNSLNFSMTSAIFNRKIDL